MTRPQKDLQNLCESEIYPYKFCLYMLNMQNKVLPVIHIDNRLTVDDRLDPSSGLSLIKSPRLFSSASLFSVTAWPSPVCLGCLDRHGVLLGLPTSASNDIGHRP